MSGHGGLPARRLRRADDAELVTAARAGDRGARDELLRRCTGRITAVCTHVCRDPVEAEDAAQEALLAVSRGLDGFRGDSSFGTWVHRVAVTRSLDQLRRRARAPVPVDTGPASVRSGAPLRVVGPRAAADPADEIGDPAARRDLFTALAELPDEFRDAVVLRDVLDLDYAEIATELGVPPGTVRSRIARGRARLADRLGDGPAPEPGTGGPAAPSNGGDEP